MATDTHALDLMARNAAMERRQIKLQRQINNSASIEVQLTTVEGGPVLELLSRLRAEACDAMVLLSFVDPTDEKSIRRLQNIIGRYDAVTRIACSIVDDGMVSEGTVAEEIRDELSEVIGRQDGVEDDRLAEGLEEDGTDQGGTG